MKNAVWLSLVLITSVSGNAQTPSEYSTHSVRVEGTLLLIPSGFFAYDYRPLDYLSLAVGFGSVAVDDSADINQSGYMTRVSWLLGKNSKYVELGGGIVVGNSTYPLFILASYRYQPTNGWLWGTGIRFTYPIVGEDEGSISLLSLVGISFQFGYAL